MLLKCISQEDSKITEEQIKEITDDPKVQEILNSPETQELMEKYLDATITGLTEDDNLDDISIEKDMVDFIKDNPDIPLNGNIRIIIYKKLSILKIFSIRKRIIYSSE